MTENTRLLYPEGVSKNFPYRTEMEECDIKEMDSSWELTDDFFNSLVGADCWGVYITRHNGSLIPIFNTYALYDKINQSFGVGHRSTPQYREERRVRERLIDDITPLLDDLEYEDTASIMMFGSHPWRIDATRNSSNEITYKALASQPFIDRYITKTSNQECDHPCQCHHDDSD